MSEFMAFLAKNPLLTAALLGTAAAWVIWELKQLRRGFIALSPNQLVEWINRKDARVVDLADNNDFLKMHIGGAVNIPLSDFSATHKAIHSAQDKPVVVYDRSGVKADGAAVKLVAAGFKQVGLLSGGLDAWLRESLPTAKGK
jgi:rhodanese-related sulfurtransferase